MWHYIQQELLVAGTARSKFHNLVRLAQLILTLPHSNADEERVFSRIGKNKTKFRASLSPDRTLPSIITFQMNRSTSEPCFKYEPSRDVCKAAEHVTWQYNKEDSTTALTAGNTPQCSRLTNAVTQLHRPTAFCFFPFFSNNMQFNQLHVVEE
jgi:hypothetical protein